MNRTCACICGGSITAEDAFPVLVEQAVRLHNGTAEHLLWREAGGFWPFRTFVREPRGLDAYEGQIAWAA